MNNIYSGTVVHCSAPCIHVENGCCLKRDVIIRFIQIDDQHSSYSYCCHFEEVKDEVTVKPKTL
jgi:hypothetical protein